MRSRTQFNTYVVVTARYEDASGTPLSRPLLFAALEQTIGKHVALACRLPAPPAPQTWLALPSVDLNKVVSFLDKDSSGLSGVLEDLFAKPIDFSEDAPLWKLLVLRDGTVAFAYDHAIGDGQSGIAFHRTLLSELRSLQDGPSSHSGVVAILPTDVSMPPALEDAMDVSPPLLTVAGAVAKMVLPFLNYKEPTAWSGHPAVSSLTLLTTVRVIHYTPTDAARLLSVCRQHGATITTALHTVAIVVLSRLIKAQAESAAEFNTISTTVPVSMRRYTGAPATAMCNHISVYADYHPLLTRSSSDPSAFPWDAAAAFSETLRREAPRSAPAMGMLKYVSGKYEEFLSGQMGKKRSAGLELSNVGPFPKLDAGADGASSTWRIEEVLFAQANATVGSALKLNVAGTPAGGLGVTVTWGKGSVDDGFAEEFVREFDAGVKALLVPS